MSTTFLRGLALVEIVAADGPIGVSELSRRLGVDKAGVSRMVTAATADGWLTRTGAGIVLGPRLPVLAHHSDLAGSLRAAQPLVDAVAGITGLFSQAYLAVGTRVMPVLSGGRPPVSLPRLPGVELPLWSMAAGRAAASLMSPSELTATVPDGPLAAAGIPPALHAELSAVVAHPAPAEAPTPVTKAAFLAAVERVRLTGVSVDKGEVHAGIHCIAVPWSGFVEPAALCVIGTPADVAAGAELAEAVLRAAAQPGATRERVVRSAADLQRGRG